MNIYLSFFLYHYQWLSIITHSFVLFVFFSVCFCLLIANHCTRFDLINEISHQLPSLARSSSSSSSSSDDDDDDFFYHYYHHHHHHQHHILIIIHLLLLLLLLLRMFRFLLFCFSPPQLNWRLLMLLVLLGLLGLWFIWVMQLLFGWLISVGWFFFCRVLPIAAARWAAIPFFFVFFLVCVPPVWGGGCWSMPRIRSTTKN